VLTGRPRSPLERASLAPPRQLLFRLGLAAGAALAAKRALGPTLGPHARSLAAAWRLRPAQELQAERQRLEQLSTALEERASEVAHSLEDVKDLLRRVEANTPTQAPPSAAPLTPAIKEALNEIREELRAELRAAAVYGLPGESGTPARPHRASPGDPDVRGELAEIKALLRSRVGLSRPEESEQEESRTPHAPVATSVAPQAAPHPPGYLSVLELLQSGQTPPGIREIDDKAPDNRAPPSAATLRPPLKPWERAAADQGGASFTGAPGGRGGVTLTEISSDSPSPTPAPAAWKPPASPIASDASAARQLGLPGALSPPPAAPDFTALLNGDPEDVLAQDAAPS